MNSDVARLPFILAGKALSTMMPDANQAGASPVWVHLGDQIAPRLRQVGARADAARCLDETDLSGRLLLCWLPDSTLIIGCPHPRQWQATGREERQ